MEQIQSLFELEIDSLSKGYLSESAKWGKFLSIIGFIGCGLLVLAGIIMATQVGQMNKAIRDYGGQDAGFARLGPVIGIAYALVALLYFFPSLYLFRFSNHMKLALVSNDQQRLVVSFMNLKSMFKFVGILTIIVLGLYFLALLISIAIAI
jgi:hypothetical protein